MLWGENKGLQSPRVNHGQLACAASILPLSHDNQTARHPHNIISTAQVVLKCLSHTPCSHSVCAVRAPLWGNLVVMAEHWLHKPGVLGMIPGDCLPFHFPLFSLKYLQDSWMIKLNQCMKNVWRRDGLSVYTTVPQATLCCVSTLYQDIWLDNLSWVQNHLVTLLDFL